MIEHCPKCGFQLESIFKFCPNCSFDLNSLNSPSIKESVVEVILCSNCGAENKPDNKTCVECGVKLIGEKVEKTIRSITPLENSHVPKEPVKIKAVNTVKTKTTQSKKQVQKNKEQKINIAPPKKAFNKSNIITIFGVGLLLVFLIIYLSGGFTEKSQTPNQEIPSMNSGPDLSQLDEIKALEEQISNTPGNPDLVLRLAQIQQDSKLIAPAITNYKKYIAMRPEDVNSRVDLGICFYDLGNFSEAIKEMEAANKIDPKHQKACLNLGIVNMSAGNKEKSNEWLNKAISIDPVSETGKQAQEILNSHK